MGFKLIDVCEALAKLDGMLRGNGKINGSLYFLKRGLTSTIHKVSNIKSFTRMIKPVVHDETGRFTRDIAENIIKL